MVYPSQGHNAQRYPKPEHNPNMKATVTITADNRRIAYIFEDVGGYHISKHGEAMRTNSNPANSKAEAMRRAKDLGYTHATGSGTYAKSGKVVKL